VQPARSNGVRRWTLAPGRQWTVGFKTEQGIVLPTFYQVATIDNTNIFYRLVRNADLTLGGAQGWNQVQDVDSFTEFQIYDNPAAIPQLSQGTVTDSGFVVAGSGTGIALDKDTTYQMGRTDLGTVSDTLTILAAANGSNKSAIAAMTWIEQR